MAAAAPAAVMELVITLGPATAGLERELHLAGATAFRLNASHLTPSELGSALAALGAAVPAARIVVDLQGAKMRLGRFASRPVQRGQRVGLALRPVAADELPLPHPELYGAVSCGETLSIDDDRVRLRVVETGAERLVAVAAADGVLQPRKGVNVIEHPVDLLDVTVEDEACIAAALAFRDTLQLAFAFSFMKTGVEAGWVRRRAPGVAVVGKIERREACEGLSTIAAAVDALWICRGDLGAQLGAAEMARQVAAVEPRTLRVPVLMAGQVLQSLTAGSCATRSEVCHLHDILARGHGGIVLSDETAIGVDAVHATTVAAELLRDLAPPDS